MTINTRLPLRLCARVVIWKGNKVCITLRKREGVLVNCNVPGGGVEGTNTLEETATIEALEEVGLQIRNAKPLGVRLAMHHAMPKGERAATWSGTDSHYLSAEFVRVDHSLHNADGDALPYEWMEVPAAIKLIKALPFNEFNETKIQVLLVAQEQRSRSHGLPASQRW